MAILLGTVSQFDHRRPARYPRDYSLSPSSLLQDSQPLAVTPLRPVFSYLPSALPCMSISSRALVRFSLLISSLAEAIICSYEAYGYGIGFISRARSGLVLLDRERMGAIHLRDQISLFIVITTERVSHLTPAFCHSTFFLSSVHFLILSSYSSSASFILDLDHLLFAARSLSRSKSVAFWRLFVTAIPPILVRPPGLQTNTTIDPRTTC
jgi:hypothetical protein